MSRTVTTAIAIALLFVSTGAAHASTKFEFLIDGPHSPNDAVLPLHFRVTLDSGFTTDSALSEPNPLGYTFGAHIKEADGGRGQFIGASLDTQSEAAAVPEPASLLLFGIGLTATAAGFRRRSR